MASCSSSDWQSRRICILHGFFTPSQRELACLHRFPRNLLLLTFHEMEYVQDARSASLVVGYGNFSLDRTFKGFCWACLHRFGRYWLCFTWTWGICSVDLQACLRRWTLYCYRDKVLSSTESVKSSGPFRPAYSLSCLRVADSLNWLGFFERARHLCRMLIEWRH